MLHRATQGLVWSEWESMVPGSQKFSEPRSQADSGGQDKQPSTQEASQGHALTLSVKSLL